MAADMYYATYLHAQCFCRLAMCNMSFQYVRCLDGNKSVAI